MPRRTKQKPTMRPQAPPQKRKEPKKPRRGTLPLTVFEQRIFQEMGTENDRLRAAQHQLNQQYAELTRKHNDAVRALGDTHGMDFVFTVELNEKRDALNWTEVLDDQSKGKHPGASDPAPAQGG